MSASPARLVGHPEVRALLGRAAREGSLPQSILLHGPRGVGKERIGLWLAQLLLCAGSDTEPCGACRSCRMVERLEHPDLHWFFPLPRPDASSPEKLRERLEEQRSAELQRWRENPHHVPEFEKAPAHFLAAIRTVQRLASLRPVLGSRKAFVVGDAELMVPQEASPEAANAFLKLLEEPPPETTLILTSSQPGALLPTIRSRVLSVRVGLVTENEVRRFLEEEGLATVSTRGDIARRARGSVRKAIELADGESAGGSEAARKAGRDLLLAALSDGVGARLTAAHDRKPTGARADLVFELEALAQWLRDLLALITGATEQLTDPADLPILSRMAEHQPLVPETVMAALGRVEGARELALGNVNPQLIVASLLAEMQSDLRAGTRFEPSAR